MPGLRNIGKTIVLLDRTLVGETILLHDRFLRELVKCPLEFGLKQRPLENVIGLERDRFRTYVFVPATQMGIILQQPKQTVPTTERVARTETLRLVSPLLQTKQTPTEKLLEPPDNRPNLRNTALYPPPSQNDPREKRSRSVTIQNELIDPGLTKIEKVQALVQVYLKLTLTPYLSCLTLQ